MGRIQNISLLFVLFLATTFASAEEVVKNGIHYRVIETSDGSTDQLEVYNPDGTFYEGNIVILDKVEVADGVFYDVVNICESAFAGSTGLTSISIPASVRSIRENAFNGCSGLQSLVIPAGITLIEKGAFGNCANLSELIISEREEEEEETLFIDEKAFSPGSNSISLIIFSYALNPPEAEEDAFDGYTSILLYCTEDGLPNYQDSSPWCDFTPTVFSVEVEPQELPAEELEITLVQEGPYIYTGSEIKPGITFKWILEEQETIIPADEYTVSYTDSINAGTATVTVTDKEGGNYTFESVSKTYEITPAKGKLDNLLTQKPTGIDNLTYTGEALDLIQAGTVNEEIFKGQLKYSLDNEAFATDIPQGTEAQDYTVYYKVEDDPNYTASDTLSLTVTISAWGISISAGNISLDNDSYVYDGTAKKPAVTVTTGGTIIPADEYTVSYTDSINAGTATVTVTDKEDGNYTFESVSKTYEITPAKGRLDNLLTQKPAGIDNLTYTGEALDLIQAGTVNEEIFKGQLKYSLDNEAFATDIPQGTEAQDYTVYYKVEDDPNYTASDTLSLTVTISAWGISISAGNISLDNDSYVYDGTAKKPAVTVTTGGTIIPADEYTVSYTDSINAGTATVTVTDKEGGNYTFESVSKTYEITPAKGRLDNLLTQKPAGIDNLTYTGEALDLIQAGTVNEEIFKGQLKYSLDNEAFATDIPQGTEAQDYTVYYKVEGDPNYTASDTLSLTVTISAWGISISAEGISLGNDSYVYDGTAKKPAVTVTTGGTIIPAEEYTVSYADSINAGTATVTVTDKEGGNYTFESVSKRFNISPAALTISANDYEIFEGDAIPKFTVRYDGFVNNETEAVLTNKPIVSCNATATSGPGFYIISVGGASAANYIITHKSGKLTIIAMKFVTGGETSKDEDDPATYQITSTGREGGTTPTVSIVDDKEVGGAFAIPEAVTYHNTIYTVTEINESAFENNKYLTNVTIPSSITNIGDKAFKGCSNLKSITVYITTPISLAVAGIRGEVKNSDGSSVFEGVDKTSCILYVPDGSVDLYKAEPVWCEFENIVPLSILTGINGDNVTEDEPLDIYNLRGIKVKSKATDLKGLPRGIYIINGKKYSL